MKPTYQEYARVIEKFKRATILHVGDLVLDEFLFGEISRISREAPVLILKYHETIKIPGGGANAVNNLISLGARVLPVGVLGEDEAGNWLTGYFRDGGVDVSGIFRKKEYVTPVKTRILAGSFHSSMQQMLRLDHEGRIDPPACAAREIIARIEGFLPTADAIVVSDYGYNFVQEEVIAYLAGVRKKKNIPVIVDSRFHMRRFAQFTSMTPNISEVESSYHMEIGDNLARMDAAASQAMSELGLDALLITRGRLGMSLYKKDAKPVHISVFGSDEVADVTGAGDTVISVYTLALSCGSSFETAARMANYAGGLVVMKRGTATVSSKELLSAIKADHLDKLR